MPYAFLLLFGRVWITLGPFSAGLMDEGYDCPCGLCRSRASCVKTARRLAKAGEHHGEIQARIVDAQEELLPRLRLPRLAVAGQVRRRLSAGHFDRPAADLEGLPADRPRGRGGRLRARGNRQGQRPVPLPVGGRGVESGRANHCTVADWKALPTLPRPQCDDRLLQATCRSPSRPPPPSPTAATRTVFTSVTRRASWRTSTSTVSSWSISA